MMSNRSIDSRSVSRSALIGVALVLMLVTTAVMANPFGIAVHIPNASQLDLVNELGTDWIRIDFVWAFVEPEQDNFDWTLYDRLIRDSEERNLRIFATIGGTPAWATSGAEGPGVPNKPADWSDICYRAAARYRGRVEAWGMWNEPNLDRFWEGTLHEYRVQILQTGADAVHAADPQALVAGPELAHLNSADWDGWMRTCVRGALDRLDVVTHHVYPSGVGAGSVTRKLNQDGTYPWDPPSVKEVLKDTGWFGRPFWLTETGVEADQGGPWAQAVFYDDFLTQWFSHSENTTWIDRMFFYQLSDDPRFPDITFGIVGAPPEMEPRLAFDSYQDFIREAVVTDARVLSWTSNPVLAPDRWNSIVVQVVNEGTTSWRASDYLSVGIKGLPEDWEIEGGAAAENGDVTPGMIEEIELEIRPPAAGLNTPNSRHEVTFRMVREDGSGLGSPLRAGIVSGWYSLPVFVLHPLTSIVEPGGEAVFRVVPDGIGNLEMSWFQNGTLIRDGDRFSGAKTAVLTVHSADPSDTGEYRCRAKSSAGWVLSRRAELVLTGDDRGGPRESDGRTPGDPQEPAPSFERFFADAAARRAMRESISSSQ